MGSKQLAVVSVVPLATLLTAIGLATFDPVTVGCEGGEGFTMTGDGGMPDPRAGIKEDVLGVIDVGCGFAWTEVEGAALAAAMTEGVQPAAANAEDTCCPYCVAMEVRLPDWPNAGPQPATPSVAQ